MPAATYSFRGTADFSGHDSAVNKAKEKIQDYKREVDKAQRSADKLSKQNFSGAYQSHARLQRVAKNTTTVMEGLSGNIMGAIGKFGPYAAAAVAGLAAASKGVQKVMEQSDYWTDKFRGTMEGLKGAIDQFVYRIGTMDFSNLLSGLRAAYENAKNLYDAMDRLGTFTLINDNKVAELELQLSQARTRYKKAQKEGNKADIQAASDDVKRLEQAIVNQLYKSLPEIQDAKEKAMKAALDWRDYSYNNYGGAYGLQATFDKILEMKNLDGDAVERRIKELDGQLKRMTRGASNASPVYTSSEYKLAKAEYDMLQQSLKITDDQIKAVTDLEDRRRAVYQRINSMEFQDLKYQDFPSGSGGGSKVKVKVEPTFPEGSIGKLQKELKDLNAQLLIDVKQEDRDETLKKIQGVEDKLKKMQELSFPEGSLAEAEKQLSDLQDSFHLAITQEDRNNFLQQIKVLEEKISKMKGEVEVEAKPDRAPGGSIAALQEWIAHLKQQIENSPNATIRLSMALDLEKAEQQLQKLQDEALTPQQQADKLKQKLEEDIDTWGYYGDIVTSVFSGISAGMEETAQKQTEAAGQIVSSIMNIIPHILKLIGLKEAEALASGTASAASLPFPASLPAITAIVSELMAIFATISSLGKFASGGVVDGAKRLGDMNIARVNSGEMILNNQQQTRLFRMLNGVGVPSQDTSTGVVSFRISGGDLVGVLDNYNKTHKRIR